MTNRCKLMRFVDLRFAYRCPAKNASSRSSPIVAASNQAIEGYGLSAAPLEPQRFAARATRIRAGIEGPAGLAAARNNLGIALASMGRIADALAHFSAPFSCGRIYRCARQPRSSPGPVPSELIDARAQGIATRGGRPRARAKIRAGPVGPAPRGRPRQITISPGDRGESSAPAERPTADGRRRFRSSSTETTSPNSGWRR